MEDGAFSALVASIGEKGLLEPVLVTPRDGNYLLISGERRFLACRHLELPTITARVLTDVEAKAEILAIQLMENLQRQDLDPIDTANAMAAFLQARNEGMTSDAIASALITAERDPSRLDGDFAGTVTAIQNISGKSISSIRRSLSLLNLPEDMQDAVKRDRINVSLGYIFAANLDNPALRDVFNACLEKPMTQAAVESKLAAAVKGASATRKATSTPLLKFAYSMKSIKTTLAKNAGNYKQADLEKLRDDLKSLTDLVEQQLSGAQQAATPAKKSGKNPA
jgi:ParB-like chromosome segregation protein Spo0J